jgi:hypothetical protein
MLKPGACVFLLDVDNTLLDNDRFAADLGNHLDQAFGEDQRDRYWAIYRRLRNQQGYADYLGALQEFRIGMDHEPELLRMSDFLLEYPFAERLYPHALETIQHLASLGLPVVFSDGDMVFQPRKIRRSGILAAVEGRMLICLHKERALPSMQRRYPGSHYVMIDDKPQILAAMKRILGPMLTTVFVRQGHYASESIGTVVDPLPDANVRHLGDLRDRDLDFFFATANAHADARNSEGA